MDWTDDLDQLLTAIAQRSWDAQRLASQLKARWRLEKEQLVHALARRLQVRYSPMQQSPELWQGVDLSKVEEPPLLVGDIRQSRQYRLKTNDPETVALDLAAALPGQVLLVGFRVDVLATRWRQRGEKPALDIFTVWDDWAPTIAGAVTLLDHVYGPQPPALVVIGPDCHHEWSARSEWHRPGGRRKEVRATLDLFTHTVCRQCAVLWLNPLQHSHLDRTVWEVGTREALGLTPV